MKEYSILIRQGDGTPYTLKPYRNILEAKKALNEIIKLEEERQKPYYVDNDFFENKYNQAIRLKYMCIRERETTEWEKYSEEKIIQETINKYHKKIVYIENYKTS